VREDEEIVVLCVEDKTGNFTQEQLDELRRFILEDLLSTQIDLDWLSVIKIRNDARSGYEGYWTAKFRYDQENPSRVDGVQSVIVLNYFYLKTLDALKETLAHEYGHHWTLCYFSVNQGIDIWKQRIPQQYYSLRGLNEQDYALDYSQGWERCDKEVIAEDYRVLFAAHPYNQEHEMVLNSSGTLSEPNQVVQEYINNLAQSEFV